MSNSIMIVFCLFLVVVLYEISFEYLCVTNTESGTGYKMNKVRNSPCSPFNGVVSVIDKCVCKTMALVIGHSQTKYLSDYLCKGSYSVFSYSGAKARQLLDEDCIFEVVPFFSTVIVVIGANDVGTKGPRQIADDILMLCEEIHCRSPSATVLVCEILPRAQNHFEGGKLRLDFLDRWNREANSVNLLLHQLPVKKSWLRILLQPCFRTMFGATRKLLSRDGLHLSPDGLEALSRSIESSVQLPQQRPDTCPTVAVPVGLPAKRHIVGPLRYSDVTSLSLPRHSQRVLQSQRPSSASVSQHLSHLQRTSSASVSQRVLQSQRSSCASVSQHVSQLQRPSSASVSQHVSHLQRPSSASVSQRVLQSQRSSCASVSQHVSHLQRPSSASVSQRVLQSQRSSCASVSQHVSQLQRPSSASVSQHVSHLQRPSSASVSQRVLQSQRSSCASVSQHVSHLQRPSSASVSQRVLQSQRSSCASVSQHVSQLQHPSSASVSQRVLQSQRPSSASVSQHVSHLQHPSSASVSQRVLQSQRSSCASVSQHVSQLQRPSSASVSQHVSHLQRPSSASVSQRVLQSQRSSCASISQRVSQSQRPSSASVSQRVLQSQRSSSTSVSQHVSHLQRPSSASVSQRVLQSQRPSSASVLQCIPQSQRPSSTSVSQHVSHLQRPSSASVSQRVLQSQRSSCASVSQCVTQLQRPSSALVLQRVPQSQSHSSASVSQCVPQSQRSSCDSVSNHPFHLQGPFITSNRFSVLPVEETRAVHCETVQRRIRQRKPKSRATEVTESFDVDVEKGVVGVSVPAECSFELKMLVESDIVSNKPVDGSVVLLGGGREVRFEEFNNPLKTDAVVKIFTECNEGFHDERLCTSIPSNPSGGDIYVINKDRLSNIRDSRIDKFLWQNMGRKKYPKNSSKIYKTIYKIRLPDGEYSDKFQKHMYEYIGNSKYVVVHYVGESTVFVPFSHGNSKNKNSVMRRTCPSVFDDIRCRAFDVSATANLIDKEIKSTAEKGSDLGIKTTRDVRQVKNHLYKARRDQRLSNDDLYNLVEISYELEDFNKQIDIFPSLVCISALDEILQEFNELLLYDENKPIKMFYDTTYRLGELFVSVLSFQHIIFESNKIIPVAFMMHDKRDTKFHERFFSVLLNFVPNLLKTTSPIICDREPGISLAIKRIIPNLQILYCWNHIKSDIKHWLLKKKATQDDLSVYLRDLSEILKSTSEDDCIIKIKALEQTWSEEFRNYFHKYVKKTVFENSGRWILEKFKVYDMYSGITNNASESLNNVIKSIQKRRQLPIDMINLTLYFLQKYIFTEMQCGRAGFGNFRLNAEFSHAVLDPSEIKVSRFKGTPNDILQYAKDRLDRFSSGKMESSSKRMNDLEDVSDNKHSSMKSNISETEADLLEEQNVNTILDNDEFKHGHREKDLTQTMLAEDLIKNDRIKFVSSMNAFLVEGLKGSKRVVTLQPKESCSCPSTGTCYHILSVKTALNIESGSKSKRVKNLSLLKRNSRPRGAKKTGQKIPKKNDFEVNPAPDSFLSSFHNTIPLAQNFDSCSNDIDNFFIPDCIIDNSSENTCIPDDHRSSIKKHTDNIDTSEPVVPWIPKHQLNSNDRLAVQSETGLLNDKVINSAQFILKEEFKQCSGMQNTLFIPNFCDKTETWNVNHNLKRQPAPSAQIHYNGNAHWVLSYQKETCGTVFVIDSIKSQRTINANMSIQLSQIYDTDSNCIEILVPEVQRQTNSFDCGVFSVAFLTELVHSNFTVEISRLRFDIGLMRQHLYDCLQCDTLTPFPKILKMPKMPVNEPRSQRVRLHCSCKLPEIVDNMIKCQNKLCKIKWYHKRCVNVNDNFLCNLCSR